MEDVDQKLTQARVYTSLTTVPYSTKIEYLGPMSIKLKTNYPPLLGEDVTFELIDSGFSRCYIGNGKVVSVKEPIPGKEGEFELEFDMALPTDVAKRTLH